MSERFTVRHCPEHGLQEHHSMGRCMVYVAALQHNWCGNQMGEPFEVVRVPAADENHDGLVSHNHGATARHAALEVRPRSGTQRAKVLEAIEVHGPVGLTRDEIAEWLSMSPNTVRPRVKELLDGHHIYASDVRRLSSSGRPSEVLVLEGGARRWGR